MADVSKYQMVSIEPQAGFSEAVLDSLRISPSVTASQSKKAAVSDMPREMGNAPREMVDMYKAVHDSYIKHHPSTKHKYAHRVAMMAVKRAGWKKDKNGDWKKDNKQNFGETMKGLMQRFSLNDLFEFVESKGKVTKSEVDGDHPPGHYLVVENRFKPTTWHLRVMGMDGKPDHRLMGAAWAALHGGYRGNKYEGPDKDEAIRKLKDMYKREKMETPSAEMMEQMEFAMKIVKDFPVFEAGEYPQGKFSDSDLSEIVSVYNPSLYIAGGVEGHSGDHDSRAPNLALVYGLQKVGNRIWTKGVELSESLIRAIKDGTIRYPSIELYKRDDSNSPLPGKLYLGNIGFLGAKPPAVKGLPLLKSALGFAAVHPQLVSVDQPTLEFEDVVPEDEGNEPPTGDDATENTIENIEQAFAVAIEDITNQMQSTDDPHETLNNCMGSLYEAYNNAVEEISEHFSYVNKLEDIQRAKSKVSEMMEALKRSLGISTNRQSINRKESNDMDEKQLREFAEAKANFDAEKAALAKDKAEFTERAKSEKETAIAKQLKEFKEELIKEDYPVKKLEDEGFFALAENLLHSDTEIEFGEQKTKKSGMEILKSLKGQLKPVDTTASTAFTEDEKVINLAESTNVSGNYPVDAKGMRMVQFAEAYSLKHPNECQGATHQQKRGWVTSQIMLGNLAMDEGLLS